jgi:hypothetical protein
MFRCECTNQRILPLILFLYQLKALRLRHVREGGIGVDPSADVAVRGKQTEFKHMLRQQLLSEMSAASFQRGSVGSIRDDGGTGLTPEQS